MAGPNSIDDSHWPEVENINSYAVLIGYLQMAVRMLGVLMVAWATVVLLGGFVSNLGKKDFWCLTVITLVQIARVFDFVSKEKTRAVVDCVRGLVAFLEATFLRRPWPSSKKKSVLRIARWFTRCCLWVLHVINLVVCAVSFAVLYFLGELISMGLSSWRLNSVMSGDYDSGGGASVSDNNGSAAGCCRCCKEVPGQLTPALEVLYYLGLVQCSCFMCNCMLALYLWVAPRTGLAEQVAGDYRLDARIVSKYLHKTVKGCKKDPSFAKGRNLVTYGVDLLLMEPTSTSKSSSATSSRSRSCSSKHYLSGLAILGSILQQDDDDTADTTRQWLHGQATMMKQLLTASASFGQVIHRLLETLGPASPYSGAVKVCAARILAEVAGSVRLEEFPGATQCIASLLGTFEEYCWRPEGYERDGDLPEEYERDWLLEEQERRYILENVRRSRTPPSPSLLRRLLKRFQFHHHAAANGDGSVAPPPPPSPGSDEDGGKSRGLIVRGYVGLVISGLRVLQALAASEDNCRFISSTRGGGGEVSRIMRPLASDGLHRDHHDEWCMIAEESLKLLSRLTAAPGETGEALRAQIAGHTAGAVAALETVLGCPRCQVALKRQAVEVLLSLPPPVDTSSIVVSRGSTSSSSSSSRTSVFMGILLHIFLLPDKHFGVMSGPTHLLKKRSCTRRLAGEKLLAMVSALQQPSGGDDDDGGAAASATSKSQAAGIALGNLTSTVVGAGNDASWRIHAARVLEDLCQDYTKDDEYLKEIKKAMCLAMPEVLKQLLDGCVSTTQAVTVITEAKKVVHCQEPAAGTDLEQGAVSDDAIGEETAASSHHQQAKDDNEQPAEGMELYQALVSLCHGIPNSWIEADKDLAGELNGIAAEVCAKEGMPFSIFISLRAELKHRFCWEEKNDRVRTN